MVRTNRSHEREHHRGTGGRHVESRPQGTIVIDVPMGFAIQDAAAVWSWVKLLVPTGDGGRPNTMGGVGISP